MKRPWPIWVVCAYYLLNMVSAGIGLGTLAAAGAVASADPYLAVEIALGILLMLAQAVTGIALVALRRISALLAWVVLGFSTLVQAMPLIGQHTPVSASYWLSAVVALGVNVLICLYVDGLKRQGKIT